MPSALIPAIDAESPSGRKFAAGGMKFPHALTSVIGPTAEFTWSHDLSRRC